MPQSVLDWAPAILPALVFALLLYLPGGLVLWLAGTRLRLAVLLAPLVSAALAGIAGVGLGLAGVAWTPLSFGAVSLGVAVAAGVVRLAVERSAFRMPLPGRFRAVHAWLLAGLAVNAAVVALVFVRAVGSASAITYQYDTVWHFSTIRWMLETGDGSSVDVGLLDGTAGNHFYPAGWHDLVVLAIQLTGSSIEVAVNASLLAILLVLWPLGMVALYRRLFRGSSLGVFAAASIACLPAVFPIGFLDFGVLWSNFFSLALVPLALVVCVTVLERVRRREWAALRRDAPWLAITMLATPFALLFAQPNAAFTLLVVLLPLAYGAVFAVLGPQTFPRRSALARIAGMAVLTLVLAVGWVVLHDSEFLARTVGVDWPAYETRSQALGEWAFFGNYGSGQLLLGAAALLGIVLALRAGRGRWLFVSYLTFGVLYMVAAGLGSGPGSLRDYLVGFWYHDPPRLAAVGAIVALPFVAYAIEHVSNAVGARAAARRPSSAVAVRWRSATAIALVVVLAGYTATERGMRDRVESIRSASVVSPAQWLSPTERAFLDEVAATVAPDAVVANDPFDGSGMAYSLAGVQVLFPALPGNWMGTTTEQQQLVIDGLDRMTSDPEVCAAARALRVAYVLLLEDGSRGVYGDGPDQFAGLAVTADTPGFDLVLHNGPLALYRLTACTG